MRTPEIVRELRDALGADIVFTGDDIGARHRKDWSRLPAVLPIALVRPRTTEQVSNALRICFERGQSVVPQGGMTGLAGGGRPRENDVALSLDRMNGIEELDPATATLTVLAGTPLQIVQQAANEAGFCFALDLGARGSCSIGGNLSTNAGGNRVVRYGMAREHVLGLEAVLADGTVIRSLNKMQKNNSGYDLKHLFIGSEGTLGVITRAVLKLAPKPLSVSNAFIGVPDFASVIKLLRSAQAQLGGSLSAFEVMWPSFYDFILEKLPALRRPLGGRHRYYVLMEASGSDQAADGDRFQGFLQGMAEAGVIEDAAIAQSMAEGAAMWAIRDATGEYRAILGAYVGFDISFPIGSMERVAAICEARLREAWPNIITLCYGHIGDSNLHLVCNVPGAAEQPDHAIEDMVYAVVREEGGAVSAEHGIGTIKKPYLSYSRSPEEVALMRTVKAALDPKGIMNPGKVI